MTTRVDVASVPISSLSRAAILVVGATAIFFVYQFVLQYFNWSEQAYGYYWPYRVPLILHIGGGS